MIEFEITNSTRIVSQVRIGPPRDPGDPAGHQPVVAWKSQFTAIWDTGAPFTIVVPSVVQAARLQQRGFRPVGGIGTKPQKRPAFPASVVLSTSGGKMHPQFVDVAMVEHDSHLGGAELLIGMDIIAKGETRIYRRQGALWFSFKPEQNHGR